jgi:serine/threonine-protein kinase
MQQTVDSGLRDRLQQVLGSQYRLERELGRGGMGVVFEATDTALERRVAIKVVHPQLTHHDAIVRRFLSEARMIARLRHPGIVTVHAAGSGAGLLYYVMDQVPGETLRERLQREPKLPAEEVRRIVAQLAGALDAAGRAGLVHRDVKPENVLLDAAGSRALLADFGIARAMEAEPGDDPTTGRGVALGTPTYMSPEQASGEPVDARSDLYALGVLAYEMLAGQPPFTGSVRIVVSKHLTERPVPVQKLRPDCPPDLAAAVMRALEKHPDARWQTGEELRAALAGERAVPRRRRWGLAAVAAVAALAVTGAALALGRRDGPPPGVNPRHSILVLPFTNLRADSSTAWLQDGSVNMLTLALAQWNDLTVVGPERVHDLLERARVAEGEAVGLAEARRLARDAGAWTLVLGSFERSGDSLRLAARVLDVASGAEVDLARAEGLAGADVRPLFDALAAQLLDLSGAPSGVRVGIAQSTTRSVDAYRAYLQASDHLNHWDLPAAERRYRAAIRADSTFGLAYYKLAMTRGWMIPGADSTAADAIARAELHAARLPWREQTMIRAYRTFMQGNHAGARGLYEQLLAKDSTDVDAWYGLGDAWFHETRGTVPARFTPSLRAFKRALALDPGYALAFEHVSFILSLTGRDDPPFALLPGDSIVPAVPSEGGRLPAPVVREAVARARAEAVRLARDWVALQPATPRAHEALLNAHLAMDDFAGAEQEIARFRSVASGYPELPFDQARVRVAQGELGAATRGLADALDSLTPADLAHVAGSLDVAERMAAAANLFAYRGNVTRAARVVDLSTRVRGGEASGKAAELDRDLRNWHMLGELYAAVGTPMGAMRRVWEDAAERSRALPKETRNKALAAGGSAAVGLVAAPIPDGAAVRELESLMGEPPVKEVRALLALQRADTAAARTALAEPEPPAPPMEKEGYRVFRRPLAAQAWYLLGEYDRALAAIEGFEPEHFSTTNYDMRWGMVGRVRLLRGAVLEKLGRRDEARAQYELALTQWEEADPEMQLFVQEAQRGLARVEGRS